MLGIYLGAYKAYHPGYNIVYQDINGKRDLDGDMMNIDLDPYDFIIATPPCNFWSKANINPSEYALKTAHLLPDIINKLYLSGKPFIVENVRNYPKFSKYGLFDNKRIAVYFIGRHTYWSSHLFNSFCNQDEIIIQNQSSDKRQGSNVHYVIESWLKEISLLYE